MASEPPERLQSAELQQPLIEPGTTVIRRHADYMGLGLGPAVIGHSLFVTVAPGAALYHDSGLAFWLQVPLRLQVVDGQLRQFGRLRVRREDWQDAADFAKVIRFLSVRRERRGMLLSAEVSRLSQATLGQGLVLNRYQGDIDVDRVRTGLALDVEARWGGAQLRLNDVTLTHRILGATAFVKPLAGTRLSGLARSLALGLEYAGDLNAPRCVKRNDGTAQGGQCVQGLSTPEQPPQPVYVRSDRRSGLFLTDTVAVQALGTSAEVMLHDSPLSRVHTFASWNRFVNRGGGHGGSLGVRGRFGFGSGWRSLLGFRTEYRLFGDGFAPGYFDTLYEVQKYDFAARAREYGVAATKYQQVFGDPDNGFERVRRGLRHGFSAEASWALLRGPGDAKLMALGIGLSDSTGPYDTSGYLHAQLAVAGVVEFFTTYMPSNLRSAGRLWRRSSAGRSVLLTGIRAQLLPVLFLNASYTRSFRVARSPGAEYQLGEGPFAQVSGFPTQATGRDRLFEHQQSLFVELEFGWEFEADDA